MPTRATYDIINTVEKLRPCGQAVKTEPSQGSIPGSIPGKVTIKKDTHVGCFFMLAFESNPSFARANEVGAAQPRGSLQGFRLIPGIKNARSKFCCPFFRVDLAGWLTTGGNAESVYEKRNPPAKRVVLHFRA